MFRIGEFSRLAHVSTRLLRHYDDLGLLRPAEVDSATGYRFYRAGQMQDLGRILVLRDLGFSLDQIKTMLRQPLSADQLRALWHTRREEVERELSLQRTRLDQVDRRIEELGIGDASDADDVLIRPLPARSYLSTRATLPGFGAAQALVQAMLGTLPRRIGPRRIGQMLVVQHATEFEPDALDLELGFILEAPLGKATADLEVSGRLFSTRTLEAVEEAAVCVRVGPPEEVHTRAGAIARAVEARGYRLDGENRELFLQPPRPNQPPVIEMQFPVRRFQGDS